jgi:hypothetical protein
LGVVLLTAAVLKTHQLATGPAEHSLFTYRWLLIGLVEFELALGLWLLAGVYLEQARIAALAAFYEFGSVSLYQALSGEESCGCFGEVAVNPWHTLLFDLAALAALWRWHPNAGPLVQTVRGAQNARSHSFRAIRQRTVELFPPAHRRASCLLGAPRHR